MTTAVTILAASSPLALSSSWLIFAVSRYLPIMRNIRRNYLATLTLLLGLYVSGCSSFEGSGGRTREVHSESPEVQQARSQIQEVEKWGQSRSAPTVP